GPVSDRERGRAGGDGVRGPARAGYGGRGGVGGSLPGGAAGGSDRGAPRPRGRGRGDGGAGGRAAGDRTGRVEGDRRLDAGARRERSGLERERGVTGWR